MADQYSPELLALLRQMQDVAAKDPSAAALVEKMKAADPVLLDASNGLWEPSARAAEVPLGSPESRGLVEPSSRPQPGDPTEFAYTNNPDQRLYLQEEANNYGMPAQGTPTLAELWAYRRAMNEQQKQAPMMAALPEE